MNIKRIFLLIMVALFLACLTACDSNQSNTDNMSSKNTLKIYYHDKDIITQKALGIFKEKYKDVNVDEKHFSDFDEYKNRMTVDILSGDGPDVILLDSKVFGSINKLSSKGILCDLNEFIKKDKDFNISDYNEKVLNAFEQDGKRFFIPFWFGVNSFVTSKESLKRNNIKIDPSNWTYTDLLKTAKKFAGENKNKYFFYWLDISDLIRGSGITFVDYKNKKTFYNSKDFIEILEIYRELYPYICTEEDIKGRSYTDLIKDKVFVMKADNGPSPIRFLYDYSMYKSIGEELEVLPFPALKNGNKVSNAITSYAIAINSQSSNKDNAYNFIKIVLSDDVQKSENAIILGVIPVNKKALEDDYKYAMSKKAEDLSFESCPGVPLPSKYKTISDNIVSGIGTCVAEESEISKIIKEEMPDFLDGKRTAAQTAKAIDDKVNLYLNE